jgi:hypothetical protein
LKLIAVAARCQSAQQRVPIDSISVFAPGRGAAVSPPGDAKPVDVGNIFT